MNKIIFLGLLVLISFSSFAEDFPKLRDYLKTDGTIVSMMEGGATSGGGDSDGIEVLNLVNQVKAAIFEAGVDIYPVESIKQLGEITSKVKIIITDEVIRVKVKDVVQESNAFSVNDQGKYFIFINRSRWEAEKDQMLLEELIHHEIMVLAALEATGDYHFTKIYRNFRAEYWRYVRTENHTCSIQLFEKNEGAYKDSLGKLVGSGAANIGSYGLKADMGILAKLEKDKVIIWRGVIGSSGFFKMQIEYAKLYKKSDMVDLSNTELIEPMKVYADNYIYGFKSKPVNVGEKFWVLVNCNRF
ncbi:MAG: hypothetical protein AB7I27_07225 [Bacteriovoracaceae bacterium]